MLAEDHQLGGFILVRIRRPMARWRGRPEEYVRIDGESAVRGMTQLLQWLHPSQQVWQLSPKTFTARLRKLSQRVLGQRITVLPSSLRTGGATHFFQRRDKHFSNRLWRVRWRDVRALSSYIQECTAALFRARFGAVQSARVDELSSFFDA